MSPAQVKHVSLLHLWRTGWALDTQVFVNKHFLSSVGEIHRELKPAFREATTSLFKFPLFLQCQNQPRFILPVNRKSPFCWNCFSPWLSLLKSQETDKQLLNCRVAVCGLLKCCPHHLYSNSCFSGAYLTTPRTKASCAKLKSASLEVIPATKFFS